MHFEKRKAETYGIAMIGCRGDWLKLRWYRIEARS
jgi:hypothetical protein